MPRLDELSFRWPWRPYQLRVLEAIDRHLDDGRLHVVAAPGAGKTSLGLEVFRRLGRPALVLAPTRTIRNQWVRRLEDFTPDGAPSPSWTSTELTEPAFFTAATYQALLMKMRADEDGRSDAAAAPEDEPVRASLAPSQDDEASLIELLQRAEVGTLILDEAHHLKRAWWRSLQRVVESIPELNLVALTGTPPYDATGHEWRRYEELCGPIDEEISAPELVKARTLCPHQDFVYAVAPATDEADTVAEHDRRVRETLAELRSDPRFQAAVDGHPWMGPNPPIEEILDQPELAFALLSFAQSTGAGTPFDLRHALDLGDQPVPALELADWDVLLRGRLFGSTFAEDPNESREFARSLREEGLLWRRTLRLEQAPDVDRALSRSRAKIDACLAIHEAERAVRRDELRQVYLFDFIRDEVLDGLPGDTPIDLGAVPVFDALGVEDMALLTGRVVAVHASREELVRSRLPDVSVSALPNRPSWRRLTGVPTGRVVSALTDLLGEGHLRVLVGTRALLGEGWDAPVVNSVVLGSYVGAFVSTNQMRGRGIRADPRDRSKVASVWHLVAVDPRSELGRRDLAQLEARFRTFVGLSADGSVIESGLGRLDAPVTVNPSDLSSSNEEFVRRLGRLSHVAVAWHDAIERSEAGQVVPTVSFRSPPSMRPVHIANTLRVALKELGFAALFAAGGMLHAAASGAGVFVMAGASIPMLILAPRMVRTARMAWRHAPVDGSVREIGRAVMRALSECGLLDSRDVQLHVDRDRDGSVLISASGGTFRDHSTFADAIGEVLGPVGNPRYLITRSYGRKRSRLDYHAVPSVFGTKRELAEAFHAAWIELVGPGELLYTRREGGRRMLLAARARAFANQFDDPAERVERWR
ncbi:MAG: DEAD/DEAH box helicase family protein [Gemmatimonadota bacterium]